MSASLQHLATSTIQPRYVSSAAQTDRGKQVSQTHSHDNVTPGRRDNATLLRRPQHGRDRSSARVTSATVS